MTEEVRPAQGGQREGKEASSPVVVEERLRLEGTRNSSSPRDASLISEATISVSAVRDAIIMDTTTTTHA